MIPFPVAQSATVYIIYTISYHIYYIISYACEQELTVLPEVATVKEIISLSSQYVIATAHKHAVAPSMCLYIYIYIYIYT